MSLIVAASVLLVSLLVRVALEHMLPPRVRVPTEPVRHGPALVVVEVSDGDQRFDPTRLRQSSAIRAATPTIFSTPASAG
jgi:hypothetical protein